MTLEPHRREHRRVEASRRLTFREVAWLSQPNGFQVSHEPGR